jgi:hypothetical protein
VVNRYVFTVLRQAPARVLTVPPGCNGADKMRVYRFSLCLITMWLGMGLLVPVAVAEEVAESEAIVLEDTDLDGSLEAGIATALFDGPEGGCEQLGRFIFDFGLRNYVYRGNMFEIDVDAVVTEFGFELEIPTDVEVDLYFSIHTETVAGRPYFERSAYLETDVIKNVTGEGVPVFYSTGDLSAPVPLDAGTAYVLAVAWGLPQGKYARDPSQSGGTRFPNFPNGIYVGTVSINLDSQTEPPLIDGEDGRVMLANTSGGPWSMLLCLAGACCLPDTTCADLSANACLTAGGTFTAPGLACTADVCPLDSGACCLENGACVSNNEYRCDFEGGTWFIDESCDQTFPPCEPRGGCCLPLDQGCEDDVTEAACITDVGQGGYGGWWRGEGNACEDFPPCTAGACCDGAECIFELTAEDCLEGGGLFAGFGSNCDLDPCDPVGACCYYPADPEEDPYCIDGKSEGQCAAESGVYRGDWSLCAMLELPCDGGGACCVEGVACFEAQQSTCEDFSGSYNDGVACAELDPLCPGNCCWQLGCATGREPWECETLPLGTGSGFFIGYELPCDWDLAACLAADSGACCLPDGGCIQATQAACVFEVGGVYRGNDSLCGSVAPPCAPPLMGACCLVGGDCAELTQAECEDPPLEGYYLGDAEACEPGVCAAGACCVPLETCVLTDGAACKALDPLASFAAGVPCLESACPATGPCCLPNGDCAEQMELVCIGNGGVYRGDGQICADLNPSCPSAAACCTDLVPPCQMLTDFGCDDVGGRFQGDGSACEANTCNPGACCLPDGTCEVDSLALECEGQSGILHEAEECPPLAGCDPAGACCLAPEACQSLTAAACADAGGEHAGDDVPCDDQICLPGACCLLTGDCLDDEYVFQCEASDGDFVSGNSCSGITCNPRGACCDQDNTCMILTEDSCAALGLAYAGDGVPCSDGACTLGACCLLAGECLDDESAFQCDASNGDFVSGSPCSEVTCDARGACCDLDGSCAILTGEGCTSLDLAYAGDGIPCTDGICTLGACCRLTGECLDDEYVFQCEDGDFVSGDFCSEITCDPRGACCDLDDMCTVLTEESCTGLGYEYVGTGIPCEPDPCLVILDSDPPSGAIDARQPSDPDGSNPDGWQTVVIGFSGSTAGMTEEDFTVDVTSGTAPTIISVLPIGTTAVIDFDGPIPAGAWTRITHDDSGTSVCLGYLPADSDGDRTSAPADILKVIDHLNGVDVRPIYSVDMDRDGDPAPADILRVIDLLNGAATYDPWLDASLPQSPCDGP